MTPAGIEPATFQFVAQNLNHCATAIPNICRYMVYMCINISKLNIFFQEVSLAN